MNPQQCIKLYSSNKILYNIYNSNNKFKHYYFTPKNQLELQLAVDYYLDNYIEAIKKYGHISNWIIKYKINRIYMICPITKRICTEKFHFRNIDEWNTKDIIYHFSIY